MKSKITLALAALITTVFATSCAQDYVCVCNQNGVEKYRYSLTDQYDKGAKSKCDDKQTTLGNAYSCFIEE